MEMISKIMYSLKQGLKGVFSNKKILKWVLNALGLKTENC